MRVARARVGTQREESRQRVEVHADSRPMERWQQRGTGLGVGLRATPLQNISLSNSKGADDGQVPTLGRQRQRRATLRRALLSISRRSEDRFYSHEVTVSRGR